MSIQSVARVLGPADGEAVLLGSMGARFMISGEESGGGFSLVEHPIPGRALAAPLHRHSREDEYSFVLEGRVGALLGDEVVYGGPGDLIFKPRDQWHTFWNAGEEPARILELISPAGFEGYFKEIARLGPTAATGRARRDRRTPRVGGRCRQHPATGREVGAPLRAGQGLSRADPPPDRVR
jgi:mannose-6-phosphate isomerase-like protein (cupin superfamily)